MLVKWQVLDDPFNYEFDNACGRIQLHVAAKNKFSYENAFLLINRPNMSTLNTGDL